MTLMAKKEEAQNIIDETNEQETTIDIAELSTEERIERLEYLLDQLTRQHNLLAEHSHDTHGRVVVPY